MTALPAKLCGITSAADAALALDHGAGALGFILFAASPRAVGASAAGAIIRALARPCVAVAVFVQPTLADVAAALREAPFAAVQLSGDEPPALVREVAGLGVPVVKAVRLTGEADLDRAAAYAPFARALLVEASDPAGRFGGTGRTADWGLARAARRLGRPLILAGGLTAANVAAAIEAALPDAVDVASGVEAAPGRKDPERVRAFLAAVSATRAASARTPRSFADLLATAPVPRGARAGLLLRAGTGRLDVVPSSREVLNGLRADGWYEGGQKGSHVQLRHPTKSGRTTVPHPKKILKRGLLRSIEQQSGVKLT